MKGKCIMMQGTGSTVGKSLLTAAYLRILKQDGFSAAPFKSQNMALNSFVTSDGCEMGRAQAMQAEAAGIAPDCAMNPILIKPTADMSAQVVWKGRVQGNFSAMEYHLQKDGYRKGITEIYNRLEGAYDYVVIEGAGSPAEINLRENDLVNMGMAAIADAPVLLIGDIDKGGVFASLYGTIKLLNEDERERVKAVIINKFRGDIEILRPGLEQLAELTGVPVLGVIPYMDIDLEDEDSVTERFNKNTLAGAEVKAGIVELPYMSNFTDFNNLYREYGVGVAYIKNPAQVEGKDLIIIPGSKNTIGDLNFIRQNGVFGKLREAAEAGALVMGVCGGYQMLGRKIYDPKGMETGLKEAEGLGLLDFEVTLEEEKTLSQSSGRMESVDNGVFAGLSGCSLEGYEIHMGQNRFGSAAVPLAYLHKRGDEDVCVLDMVTNEAGNVFGTYLHGIFDNGVFLRGLVDGIRKQKGLQSIPDDVLSFATFKENEYDRLADIVRHNSDMELFYDILNGKK
jgi:adenosylcobyric acid synthase